MLYDKAYIYGSIDAIFGDMHMIVISFFMQYHISRVSCRKDPTRRAYVWQIGPFWQDTLQIHDSLLWYVFLFLAHTFKI